ncbi:MAG: radical SAM protein [Desulfobacterales bacterium]|nr:radical SAM protein [Desulfobacterales bacterium]
MNILFIAPPYPFEEIPAIPLGLCYAAAACEMAGATVTVLDLIVTEYTSAKLKQTIDDCSPVMIGATSVTLNVNRATSLLKEAKQYCPSAVTVIGGPHVTFDYTSILNTFPEIDIVVLGEGEVTLQSLLPVLQDRNSWECIEGIAFRKEGNIIVTPKRPFIENLDSFPLPARHLLPISKYLALGVPANIITSRGCPNNCIFCVGRRMVGYKVRYRSIANVLDEVEQLLAYGFPLINIADDLFTSNRKRVISFCNAIHAKGLKFIWSAFTRVNTIDESLLEIMKAAGCIAVSFGVESGNPEILESLQKNITLNQAREAAAICKKVQMSVIASFIIGLPGESPETLQETKAFAESLGVRFGYHILAPFPGTTVRENIESYDLQILSNDWDKYDANHAIVQTSKIRPDELEAFTKTVDDVIQEIIKEYKEHYQNGLATLEERSFIEYQDRMKLIFQILSNDLIEHILPIQIHDQKPEEILISYLVEKTGMTPQATQRIVHIICESGLLGYTIQDGFLQWFWTSNDHLLNRSKKTLAA